MSVSFLKSGAQRIAYEHIPGQGTGVMLVLGHTSAMATSRKAAHIRDMCLQHNVPFTAFDYAGYGNSSGEPALWQTDTWLQNMVDVIDHVVDAPVIVIGNSMGGFLMLMAALCRPDKVHGLIGLCPGFGSYFQKTGHTDIRLGSCRIDIGFDAEPVPYHFIAQTLEIHQPVRLLHGLADQTVPAKTSLNIAEQLRSEDVQIQLFKSCDHALEHPNVMAALWRYVTELRSLQPV